MKKVISILCLYFLAVSCMPAPESKKKKVKSKSYLKMRKSCIGDIPKNAVLCARDNELIGYQSTFRTLVLGCTSRKCEYTCKNNFKFLNGVCVGGAAARIGRCLGNRPNDTNLCHDDKNNIGTADLNYSLVEKCTPTRKCQLVCKPSKNFVNGACEDAPLRRGECRGNILPNTILCKDDNKNIGIQDINYLLVPSCRSTHKCELVCIPGKVPIKGACRTPVGKCVGHRPNDTNLCHDDKNNIGTADLNYSLVEKCTPTRKCQLVCKPSKNFVDGACEDAPLRRGECRGNILPNTILCKDDNKNIGIQDINYLLVSSCGSTRKCELLCEDGKSLIDGVCVSQKMSSLITTLKVLEVAGVGSDSQIISKVIPLPYGQYQDASQFHLKNSSGSIIPAQFEMLNRWWGKDQSLRHIIVYFSPKVSAFNGQTKNSGIAEFSLYAGAETAQVNNSLDISESSNKITVKNGLIQADFLKNANELLVTFLNKGQLSTLFHPEHGDSINSFKRSDITLSVEKKGPLYAVVKAQAPTLFHGSNTNTDRTCDETKGCNITHGWAMRMYFYAGIKGVKVDFQLQNSAINSKYSGPIYFKGLDLVLKSNINTVFKSLKAEEPPTSNIYDLPLGILASKKVNIYYRNFHEMFPSGLSQNSNGQIKIELFPLWGSQFRTIPVMKPDPNHPDRLVPNLITVEGGSSTPEFKHQYENSGLYWMDDMRHLYKEFYLDFNEGISSAKREKMAKSFQFPPVATLTTEYYHQSKATLDLGGHIPASSFKNQSIELSLSRRPNYESTQSYRNKYNLQIGTYGFGMNNFHMSRNYHGSSDFSRKKDPNATGNWAYSGQQFIVSKNPKEYYELQNFALAEINIRPQWLSGYKYTKNTDSISPSQDGYGGVSWRHFAGWTSEHARTDTEYKDKSHRTAAPRDDAHGWFYHVDHYYFLSGNLWIKDWYEFIAEFRKVFLTDSDTYAQPGEIRRTSSRAKGHALANALSAYKVTGDVQLKQFLTEYMSKHIIPETKYCNSPRYDNIKTCDKLTNKENPYGILGSLTQESTGPVRNESAFQMGYLLRQLINLFLEIDYTNSEELIDYIGQSLKWNDEISNFGYYHSIFSTSKQADMNKTSLTIVDPLIWYIIHTENDQYMPNLNKFMQFGPFGDFEKWLGQFESRLYCYYTQDIL